MTFCPDEVVTTVITMEEQIRGWSAQMPWVTDAQRSVAHDEWRLGLMAFFAKWEVRPGDQRAAVIVERLPGQQWRIWTMDLI